MLKVYNNTATKKILKLLPIPQFNLIKLIKITFTIF